MHLIEQAPPTSSFLPLRPIHFYSALMRVRCISLLRASRQCYHHESPRSSLDHANNQYVNPTQVCKASCYTTGLNCQHLPMRMTAQTPPTATVIVTGSNDEILFGTDLIAAAARSKSLPIIVSTGNRRRCTRGRGRERGREQQQGMRNRFRRLASGRECRRAPGRASGWRPLARPTYGRRLCT